MFTRTQALEFAKASAADAWDQQTAYADSIASYRENVRDTLNDERASQYEAEAFALYDAEIVRLFADDSANTNAGQFKQACARAVSLSLTPDYRGCGVHVNATVRVSNGEPCITGYTLSDWTDGTTVATYLNGQPR
jgi:hypothetical protein